VDDSPVLQAMRAFGATPQQIERERERIQQRNAQEAFGVWAENWHAFSVFAAMETQWRAQATPAGIWWQGLDHSALPVHLQATQSMRHARPLSVLLRQIKQMELVAAEEMNAALSGEAAAPLPR